MKSGKKIAGESPAPAAGFDPGIKKRVISMARRHFLQRGFRGVSMDELAQSLGMSKRTIYELFPAKEALIEAVINQKFSQVEAELESLTSGPQLEFLELWKQLFACMHRQISEVQPAFVHDIRRHAPEIFDLIEKKRRALIERYVERLIRRGQESGNIRSDASAGFFVEMMLALISAMITPQKMEELNMTPQHGLMTVFSVVFEGLLTRKGRAML